MSESLEGLNLAELLDRLEPIPEPAPISLLPQTTGWLWLGLVLAVAGGIFAWRAWRRYRANAYRRAALAELAAAGTDAAAVAAILRRAALAAFPRTDVAGLYGEQWLAFLDRTYGGDGFRKGDGRTLISATYGNDAGGAGLAAVAAQWLRRHRTDTGPDA